LTVNRCFGVTYFMLVSFLAYSFTLKTEVSVFLWNVSLVSMDYMALHARGQNSS
jgi:hypothetical protein